MRPYQVLPCQLDKIAIYNFKSKKFVTPPIRNTVSNREILRQQCDKMNKASK